MNPSKTPEARRAYRQKNLTVLREQDKQAKRRAADRDPAGRILAFARRRARKFGVPFDLTKADIYIPQRCPVLGILLKRSSGYNRDAAPSIDRHIPALGYVRGNITVMSTRANILKRDATLGEVRDLLAHMELQALLGAIA